MDEEVSSTIQQTYIMIDQNENNAETKATAYEWIKTERAGDISYFKELLIENDIEYVVFIDGTRINSQLIGDVAVKLDNIENRLIYGQDFQRVDLNETYTPPVHVKATNAILEKKVNPVYELLKKAKKQTQKVNISIDVLIPSQELYRIITDNFEDGEKEIGDFILECLDDNAIKESIIRSLKESYSIIDGN